MSAMIDLGSRIEEASRSRIDVAGDSRIGPASYPGVVDFGPLLERLPAIGLEDLASQAALLKRTDRKYLLDRALTAELVEYLCSIQAEVLSIGGAREFGYLSDYFDTPDFALYRAAATKRRRRFKVRSRVYLDAGLRFVELKTRSGRGQNVKDRLRLDDVPMDVCERLKRGLPVEALDLTPDVTGCPRIREWLAARLTERGVVQTRRAGARAVGELAWVIRSVYTRTTFRLPGDSRLTMDQGLTLSTPSGWSPLRVPEVVVETKSSKHPCEADRWLWRRGVRPVRLSKYAVGMAAINPGLPANRWSKTIATLGGIA